jgi:hypothetical protein
LAVLKNRFMKKFLGILSVVLLGSFGAKAQLQKGNVLVGGNIADFNLGLDGGSNFSMSLNPKAAWFIQNNVAIGGTVGLGLQTSNGGGTSTTYNVGALARYYFNNSEVNLLKHGRWFLEGVAGVGGTNYGNGGGSTNGLNLSFGPGYAYFITPNIGLEGLLKYDGNVGFGNAVTTNKLNLNIGFQIYLPGKATSNMRSDNIK